ncbi:type II CAAX endopeptidase family protein [Psychrobacillus sp. FSL H8-0483]|uniref:CPBP family intramembrane glutamic endopeptidase n=1 Tax=Psychrobacillus sp. FSL H8-0483 TaxID=2921389 RepID=UPI00315A7249
MNNRELYFKQTPWAWGELLLLLGLVLVVVPYFIEFLLEGFLAELFQNNLYSGTFVGFIMSIIFTLGIYFIALRPNRLSWRNVGLTRFPRNYWIPLAGWTFVLIIVSIAIAIGMEVLGGELENSKTESLQSRMTLINFVIAFVSASIVSPIYEEIFYRGFLYRWFRGKYGILIGMVVSSLIFMVVHIPTYNVLPTALVSGLFFSWTYEKTGSIIPGIIMHSTFNGIALIVTVFA